MDWDLKLRTELFSLAVIELSKKKDYSIAKKTVVNQLVKAGTSVGSNYRDSQRARSDKEFIAKINIVLEDANECVFWLELIHEKKWFDVSALLKRSQRINLHLRNHPKKMNTKPSSNL